MNGESAIQRIADDLRHLGVEPGGVLLVHASLSAMGHVPGGAQTVVRGLIDALGDSGTLLMPALSYATVGPGRPWFDVRNTPSCVGAITEHFRQRPDTRRSIHPTHSVCGIGPGADEMLAEHHHDNTPCGAHSPFRKLRDVGGQILMLGCGLRPNTSFHGVEEIVQPPYLFKGSFDCKVTLADGSQTTLRTKYHDFAGYRQRYDRIERLLDEPALRQGTILDATSYLIDAPAMWDQALAAYRFDQLIFVESTVHVHMTNAFDDDAPGSNGDSPGGGGTSNAPAPRADLIDEYLRWRDPNARQMLCTNCGEANSRFATYCRRCNMPIGQYAATDPWHHIFIEGHGYRTAARKPASLSWVIAMWLIFLPGLIGIGVGAYHWIFHGRQSFGRVLSGAQIIPGQAAESDPLRPAWLGMEVVGSVLALGMLVVYLLILLRVTSNYLRRPRQTAGEPGPAGRR